jgi:TonB dependent receptor
LSFVHLPLPITGGLTNFAPPTDLFPLDHDQRNTLNFGGVVTLPWRSFASTNIYYGSGFSNAFPEAPYPGDHLPQHTTFDLSIGKDFGESFSASLNALNVTGRRVGLDNCQTFGGFHWNNPREIYAEVRYRFHYYVWIDFEKSNTKSCEVISSECGSEPNNALPTFRYLNWYFLFTQTASSRQETRHQFVTKTKLFWRLRTLGKHGIARQAKGFSCCTSKLTR